MFRLLKRIKDGLIFGGVVQHDATNWPICKVNWPENELREEMYLWGNLLRALINNNVGAEYLYPLKAIPREFPIVNTCPLGGPMQPKFLPKFRREFCREFRRKKRIPKIHPHMADFDNLCVVGSEFAWRTRFRAPFPTDFT